MKFLSEYAEFDPVPELRFEKRRRKEGAKTDVFDVFRGDLQMGQIRWSSRIRGYSFQPIRECEQEIADFIRGLMADRRGR